MPSTPMQRQAPEIGSIRTEHYCTLHALRLQTLCQCHTLDLLPDLSQSDLTVLDFTSAAKYTQALIIRMLHDARSYGSKLWRVHVRC